MNSRPVRALAAAALVAAACRLGPQAADPAQGSRLEILSEAVARRISDPDEAARLFAAAGPGAELEAVRFQLWSEALARADAPATAWREFLDHGPPGDLGDGARLRVATRMLADGDPDGAIAILADIGVRRSGAADAVLLDHPDEQVRRAAARRLAIEDPARLRAADPAIEARVVVDLNPSQRIRRAASWRLTGSPRTAAAELGALRLRGEEERQRRLELARSEFDLGRVSQAAALMPPLARCRSAEALVRAASSRRSAWSRSPGAVARRRFASCAEAAVRALEAKPSEDERIAALELELECATEAGRLDQAVVSWRALARAGWSGARRGWLGRRLGVALARREGWSQAVRMLAGSLPVHRRCLVYWSGGDNPGGLAALEGAPSPDLYLLWAREHHGVAAAGEIPEAAPDPAPGRVPSTVQWLLDRDLGVLASQEWARLADLRGTTQSEALGAADFEWARGRPDLAVGWLRRGFPRLGGIDTVTAPASAVRAYVPLPWRAELERAAAEAGIDPWLLAGVARQESLFNPSARSPAGAVGITQLMPGTARMHARALGLGSSPDLTDLAVNLRLGARELRLRIDEFGSLELALAAYNAGPNRVRRWRRDFADERVLTEEIPIPETYGYVRRVRFLAEVYRQVWFPQEVTNAHN